VLLAVQQVQTPTTLARLDIVVCVVSLARDQQVAVALSAMTPKRML